jgi:uncharacterized protein (DUF1501 family)
MDLSSCSDLRQALNRRGFLQVGPAALLTAGLVHTLAQRAGAAQPAPTIVRRGSARACIILFQVGGPYQCDTFDPKPLAPEEVRGPFRPARTIVPGLHFTEALPRVASQAHRLAVVRSVYHGIRCHNPAIYCSLAGREATTALAVSAQTEARRGDHPHYASVLARLRPGVPSMPHHVIVPDVVYNGPARSPGLHGGYLGARYDPFILGADPASAALRVEGTALPTGVDRTRFRGRQSLLRQVDAQCRSLDRNAAVANADVFYRRAFDLLTSSRARQAFELHREPARLRDRYGRHTMGQGALLARRLVEAGVPFVTVFSHTRVEQRSWDTHNRHYELSRTSLLPPADQSLSALLEDLALRGLLDSTLVVWMGEFGRTPRMGVQFSNNTNNVGGRDHWCNCYSVALAGGGVQGGRAVGSSDGSGGYPRERPVHISDLAATIYHALGVDPRAQLQDIQGQLRYICDGNPVLELF